MGNRKKLSLAVFLLIAALVLSMGVAYARYQEESGGDLFFQVKPLEELSIATQEWTQVGDAYMLTFSMSQEEENCRIFLAVSDGVALPENLEVVLTMSNPESIEPLTYTATVEAISESSALHSVFGSGYVFRFREMLTDAETGEETPGEELIFDLTTEIYTLTVRGLDSAAAETSLLRLFVEYAE